MKINNFILYIIVLFIHVLFGCTSAPINVDQEYINLAIGTTASPRLFLTSTLSSKSTALPSDNIIPSASPLHPRMGTPTLIPTQFVEETERMIDMLHSNDCKLPCYLSTTPGKTTLSEGATILKNIGAEYRGSYIRKQVQATEYSYQIKSGAPGHYRSNEYILQLLSLISTDDVVNIIEVGIGAVGIIDEYRAFWSNYSVKKIFQTYGIPDQIYYAYTDPDRPSLGHRILLVYERIGALIEVYGNEEDNNICTKPGYEAQSLFIHMSLYDINYDLSIHDDSRIPPTVYAEWISFKEALGVSKQEFYQQVMFNPYSCFDTIY
jgi:hypothetical protein